MKLIDMLCAVMLRYACVWQVYGADPSETGIGAECVGGTWSDVDDILCTTRHPGCHKPIQTGWHFDTNRNSTKQTNQTTKPKIPKAICMSERRDTAVLPCRLLGPLREIVTFWPDITRQVCLKLMGFHFFQGQVFQSLWESGWSAYSKKCYRSE